MDNETRVDDLVDRWEVMQGGSTPLTIEELCADCPELVAPVRRRIAILRAMDSALETEVQWPRAANWAGDGAEPSHALPEVVRATTVYRPRGRHDQGGLGVVYTAHQEELDRIVALKRIRPDMLHDQARRRFLREAALTARLQHPGIVPIYGLGQDEAGPFYIMPMIQGRTLQQAIKAFHGDEALRRDPGRRGLHLRGLLQHFVTACNTVAYAHDQGVVHRDLKPSNIMLGAYGETLVLDWGLAKQFGDESVRDDGGDGPSPNPSSDDVTATGQVLGTPNFMSPEQAKGEPAGPAADIFSLGLVLYAIVTGEAAFETAGLQGVDPLKAVREAAIVPPRRRDPRLSRGLEAICLKALAARPEDRYPTARALAEDVTRWLGDEPVSAWREPLGPRARRWARCNRTTVTAAGVALLASVVGLAAVLVVQTEAKADIGRALKRETRANVALADANTKVQARYELAMEAIKTFHTGVSEDFLLKQDQFKELRDGLLKSAADFYGKLGALLGKETDVDSRRALAAANFEVADLTGKVGRQEDALAAHRSVLAARESLASEPEADAHARVEAGRSMVAVAQLLEATGQTAEALAECRRAEALLAGLAPGEPAALAALAACRSRMADLLSTTGKKALALEAYRLARSEQETLAAAPGASNDVRRDLADTINRIGALLWHTGKPAEAEAEFKKALAIRQTLADDNPAVTTYPGRLAASHDSLGALLMDTGRPAEGETQYRKALAIFQELAHDKPAVIEFQSRVANSHHNLGNVLMDTGKPAEAEAEFARAVAIYQKLADENPAVIEFRSRLAGSHNDLGILCSYTGKPLEAEAQWRKALAIQQKLADDNPAVTDFPNRLALSHNNLGILLANTGRLAEAEAEFRQSLAISQKLADDNPTTTGYRRGITMCLNNLGDLLTGTGHESEAIDYFVRSRDILEALVKENPSVDEYRNGLAFSLSGLARTRRLAGDRRAAVADLRRAIAVREGLATPSLGARYELARDHGLLARLAAEDGSGLAPAEGPLHSDRAMDVLTRVVAEGYRDLKSTAEPDFDPLRRRPDFQLLLLDLAFPANPFARPR